jgi:SNF2 family DNA or RNA helicase
LTDYLYKTEPYAHQHTAFMRSRDEEYFALLADMGTGKTKILLDTAAWLYSRGQIGLALVVAPKGVHRNWVLREVPAHLPDWTAYRAAYYDADLKKPEREHFEHVAFDPNHAGLRVIAINIDAFSTSQRWWERGAGKIVRTLLNSFPTLLMIDEASRIKTPGATCTKRLRTLSKLAPYRRIATGTIVAKSPMDVYAPFAFLSPEALGFSNFLSFKNRYGEWEQERNWQTGRNYAVLRGFRRLDELQSKVAAHSYRILKSECLDLPEKVYVRRAVELTEEQRTVYRRLQDEYILDLDNEISVPQALARMVHLQQIIGGHAPDKETPDAPPIPLYTKPEHLPRIKAVREIIEEAGEQKVIVWARFVAEIEALAQALKDLDVVTYYGATSAEDRDAAVDRFQEGSARVFIGQQRTGGLGLTLTAASVVVYYSNDFSLETRLQSEDRAHRIGQTNRVTYVDLESPRTLDGRLIEVLREKKDLADKVTGDAPAEGWLRDSGKIMQITLGD